VEKQCQGGSVLIFYMGAAMMENGGDMAGWGSMF
jgi:hypothetical protein